MSADSILADVNVLLALTVETHVHHAVATAWVLHAQPMELVLCRMSQLGFLRLLTTRAALEVDTMTNAQAWLFYERLIATEFVREIGEPGGFERPFRERSTLASASPKRWMDAYLSAFATTAGLRLVTFDATLAHYTPRSILIRA